MLEVVKMRDICCILFLFRIIQSLLVLICAGTAVYIAFSIRKVVSEFNESLGLMACIFILGLVPLAVISIDFATNSNPNAVIFVRCLSIDVSVIIILFIQFVNIFFISLLVY